METHNNNVWKIAVVIPCYKEKTHVLNVLSNIPRNVDYIFCIDDACPEKTGNHIEENSRDSRVKVIEHATNQGVGGAMITGYQAALDAGAEIVVKIDGDGQMDPAMISRFIYPIIEGKADYTKGNRFYRLEDLSSMPKIRLFGNAILSFMSKLSTGYWQIFDPNNGFTAIHSNLLRNIPMDKISKNFFYESDILFRLNILRAVVFDIPMRAKYGDEKSKLKIYSSIFIFSYRHSFNFFKRIIYNYFLRDFSVASLEWILGPLLLIFGIFFGLDRWVTSVHEHTTATAGTVMLAALPIIIGIQLFLSALNYDINNKPEYPVHLLLENKDSHL